MEFVGFAHNNEQAGRPSTGYKNKAGGIAAARPKPG